MTSLKLSSSSANFPPQLKKAWTADLENSMHKQKLKYIMCAPQVKIETDHELAENDGIIWNVLPAGLYRGLKHLSGTLVCPQFMLWD